MTRQQQNILTLLYQYRFLNRLQIQSFLNHKTHNRINSWLKHLYENNYIERIYSNKFGENTKPAIYYIGPNGIRFLKTQSNLPPESVRRLYRETDRSEAFIDRCLLLADICLTLHRANAASDDDRAEPLYVVTTTPDVLFPTNQFHFLADLKPQLVIAKRMAGSAPAYSLVEIFNQRLPAHAARKRLKTFLAFYFSNEWEGNAGVPFPSLLIVCPTVADLIRAKRYARKLLEDNQEPDDLSIWFTTVDKLKAVGITGEIWESVG